MIVVAILPRQRCDQPHADGDQHQFRQVGDAELAHQTRPILFDRLRAEIHVDADLPVRAPFSHQLENAALPCRQQVPSGLGRRHFMAADVGLHKIAVELRAQMFLAQQDDAHRRHQIIEGGVFQYIAIDARPQCLAHIFVVLVHRKRNDANTRRSALDCCNGIDTVHAGKRKIHQYQIRAQRDCQLAGLPAISCLPRHVISHLRGQHRTQTRAQKIMVFHDQHTAVVIHLRLPLRTTQKCERHPH